MSKKYERQTVKTINYLKRPASYQKHHHHLNVWFCLLFSARMAGLQEDNKNLKLSLSKVEAERKQAQERSNNLEKVYTGSTSVVVEVFINIWKYF